MAEQAAARAAEEAAAAATDASQAPQQPTAPQQRPPQAPQQQPAAFTSQRAPLVETPQVVTDRMLKRIIMFAGAPVVVGVLLLPLFYAISMQFRARGDDFPVWVVYIAQLFTFGGGLAGITYGILSSSWDPMREGSFWGWTEFRANLPIVLNRNKQQ